jgi:hypothetical protein
MRKFILKTAAAAFFLPALAVSAPALAHNHAATATTAHVAVYAPITVAEVEAAQRAWGEALVAISTTYDRDGLAAATTLAGTVLDTAYGYDMGPVLFKPTLTTAPNTFRTTREGALAYFVGGNSAFPDTGFALKHWRSFEIENAAIVITGNTAISMGNVILTDASGNVTTVDKTWGYVRDGEGNLRIVLHHSSLPYVPS